MAHYRQNLRTDRGHFGFWLEIGLIYLVLFAVVLGLIGLISLHHHHH